MVRPADRRDPPEAGPDDAGLSRDHTGRGWARPRRQSSRSECVGRILDDFGRRGRVGKQRSRESRTSLEVPDHYKRENPGGGERTRCACVAEGLPGGRRAGERRSSCVHAALPAGDMRCQFLCPSTLAHREHARAKEYAPHHLLRQLGGAAPHCMRTREQLCFPGGDGA